MNSFWNKNKDLFIKRFPQLASVMKDAMKESEKTPHPFWSVESAKNGSLTVRENSLLLHSAYNPEREAMQTVLAQADNNPMAAVFLAFGTGYLPIAYAATHKGVPIVLVEPDVHHFLGAMNLLDWENILTHPQCILAVGCPPHEIIPIINHFGTKNCIFFSQKNQTEHAKDFFDNLQSLIERNKRKDEINNSTLERFSNLWLKNSCKNLPFFTKCSGVNIYKGNAKNIPAVVLAAGPSLEDVLPHLAEIKKRSIVICVDTALRSCLRVHVEPDFIVLVDPQYWAAQHLAGLKSPSSVLITESAAYPSVLHFECRKIVLCSSFFPLGKYFEQILGEKGKLEAGGSVATSAWDFARLIGAPEVYVAGLDLGYPENKTHIQGSTFEEATFRHSNRIIPAETKSTGALYGIQGEMAKDYDGRPILTDKRMKLFAWWFESRIASPDSIKTFTFCPQNLAIPGIRTASVTDFIKSNVKDAEKQHFFNTSKENDLSDEQKKELQKKYDEAYSTLIESFESLYEIAKKGMRLCEKALSNPANIFSETSQKLSVIDNAIMSSSGKNSAALVFPTQSQLETLLAKESATTDEKKGALIRSKIIYREICKAVKEYLKHLN